MEVQAKLLDQQKELCQGPAHNKPRVEEQSLNSMDVIKTLESHQNVDENASRAILDGVKAYKALLRHEGLSQVSANSCMLARGPDPSWSLERNFTTNGTQGNLHCPFSKPQTPRSGSQARSEQGDAPKIETDTCGHAELDPIEAEREERRSSTSQSARAPSSTGQCPVSRCPIRYMDKHSPEAVAEYVEKHKHEIPRSHAICVKRYQRDPQNMRQLDAKYGGLINMISGLSAKHQAFLPSRQANGDGDRHTSNSASTERVGKWAENVDPVTPGPANEANEDENRQGHFDRPLREVRVGESPSRPWGIPVPITQDPTPSAPVNELTSVPISPEHHPVDADKAPVEASTKPTGRCPFGHDAPKPDPEPATLDSPWASWAKETTQDSLWDGTKEARNKMNEPLEGLKNEHTTMKTDTHAVPSHVTFNGPVFFGYSAEQTASLMQQLKELGKS